jgi:hypothetical protein
LHHPSSLRLHNENSRQGNGLMLTVKNPYQRQMFESIELKMPLGFVFNRKTQNSLGVLLRVQLFADINP